MVRVMVVDDELRICRGISNYIERNIDGFTVECSLRDGDEAIEYLKDKDVEIIISDIRMLRVSGLELAKYVYENKPYIKIIMLSGFQEFEYARTAIDYGVKAYLSKPTDFGELRKTLNEVAEQLKREDRYLDGFIDHTKNMFSMIVQKKSSDALVLLGEVLDTSRSLELPRMSKYLYDFFEIIFDKVYVNMKIDLKAYGFDYEGVLELEDRDGAERFCVELLSGIFRLLQPEEDSENLILKKTKDYIDQNFSKDISLQDVADFVYLNPAYFSRFFRKTTGQTFSDYLLNRRMKHAAKLLLENVRVSEVSRACGYNNSGYFSRIFKEYYKCTPKEYGRINNASAGSINNEV